MLEKLQGWFAGLWPPVDSLGGSLGLLLALAYLLRNSVLVLWAGQSGAVWMWGTYLLLLACVTVLVSSARNKVQPLPVLLVAAAFAGSCLSALPKQSLSKWFAWALLVLVAGPALAGPAACGLRETLWRGCRLLMILIGVTSAGWYFLRLPVLGRGLFTGVMLHSMLVGPLSGLAILFSVLFAIHRRSVVWGAIAVLCLVPCLASGSRIAVLALAVSSVLTLLVSRRRWDLALLVAAALGGGLYFTGSRPVQGPTSEMTRELSEKGLQNTREDLWRARLDEFKSHPFCGVGIGLGAGEGFEIYHETGTVNIEPGSSYLALLSMTGLFGSAAFCGVLIQLGVQMYRQGRLLLQPISSEVAAVGAYLAVHAVAEGWMLAVGSPLCLVFWLWLGRLSDLTHGLGPELAASHRAGRVKSRRKRHTVPA